MPPKKQRLTKAAFDHAFKKGKRTHSPLLQIISLPGEEFHGAAVVGKKVYKSAVKRNRLRRQMYGALYRHQKKHGYTGTYIVIAKPGMKDESQKQIASTVTDLLASFL